MRLGSKFKSQVRNLVDNARAADALRVSSRGITLQGASVNACKDGSKTEEGKSAVECPLSSVWRRNASALAVDTYVIVLTWYPLRQRVWQPSEGTNSLLQVHL
jgi:hypothetical protein